MTTPPSLEDLVSLEKVIVKGINAYAKRNALIVALVEAGHKQAEIARQINAVRAENGAPKITPDAIAATLKRVSKRTK